LGDEAKEWLLQLQGYKSYLGPGSHPDKKQYVEILIHSLFIRDFTFYFSYT
jgi:hypothetical protein